MPGVASSLWLQPTGGEAGGEIRNCLTGWGGARYDLSMSSSPFWTCQRGDNERTMAVTQQSGDEREMWSRRGRSRCEFQWDTEIFLSCYATKRFSSSYFTWKLRRRRRFKSRKSTLIFWVSFPWADYCDLNETIAASCHNRRHLASVCVCCFTAILQSNGRRIRDKGGISELAIYPIWGMSSCYYGYERICKICAI